jgi:hypothetical protein
MPLRESSPEVFAELLTDYGGLLRAALESQVTRTQRDVASELKDLAERLGRFCAGPRDVVDVHTAVMTGIVKIESPPMALALTQEGRFLVLELMGHLVLFYRKYYSGTRTGPADRSTVQHPRKTESDGGVQ